MCMSKVNCSGSKLLRVYAYCSTVHESFLCIMENYSCRLKNKFEENIIIYFLNYVIMHLVKPFNLTLCYVFNKSIYYEILHSKVSTFFYLFM